MNNEQMRRPLRYHSLPPKQPVTEIKQEIEEITHFEKQGHKMMKLGEGVYLGDIDRMLETVERQMPIVNTEQIYLWELERHERIYLAMTILGLLMLALGVLI